MIETNVRFFRRTEAEAGRPINSSAEAYAYVRDLEDIDKEIFVVLILDARNRVISKELISVGTASSSLVHPREVFRAAVIAGAYSIVIAHNHPSGNPSPSPEDITITQRLGEAGKILGIKVLDHLIIGQDSFVAFSRKFPDMLQGLGDGRPEVHQA